MPFVKMSSSVLYDPSYGISYDNSKSISIPSVQFPGLFDELQEVTLLDNAVSAFYNQYPGNILKIRMNSLNPENSIIIEDIYDGSNNY